MCRSRLTIVLAGLLLLQAACDTELPKSNPYDPDLPEHQKAPATLSGQVELEAGEPATAIVEVQPAGKTATPNDAGRFTLVDLPPGTYVLRISAPGHASFTQAGLFLSAGEQVDLGEIRLDAARGSLSGNVLLMESEDQEAPTHGGVMVYVAPETTGRLAAGDVGESSMSNPDGTWLLSSVPVGMYRITGSKDEYVPSQAVEYEVTEGQTTEVSTLVLRSVSGLIRIYDTGDAGERHEVYASDPDVMVEVRGYQAYEMKLSSQTDLDELPWEPFVLEKSWSLVDQPGGADDVDGEKYVYAMFRSQDGFITPMVQDAIVLDRAPPVGAKVEIAGGAEFVDDSQVALRLFAEDALSGVAQMRTAVDGDITDESWVDYEGHRVLALDVPVNPDGVVATVQAQFRDGAGNETLTVEDSVIVDAVAPQMPTIEINDGATLTA